MKQTKTTKLQYIKGGYMYILVHIYKISLYIHIRGLFKYSLLLTLLFDCHRRNDITLVHVSSLTDDKRK